MKTTPALFEQHEIRRHYDETTETWWFSVVDIIQVLTQQSDFQTARKYWNKLKERLGKEGSQLVTDCHQLKMAADDGRQRMTGQETRDKLTDYRATHDIKKGDEYAILTNIIHQEWSGISVASHKNLKGIKAQNLRDHMTEAELIFTALAELSTRQVAETTAATGMAKNTTAAKTGGRIAKRARLDLEAQTGKKVVTGENYLPPKPGLKQLKARKR